MNEREQLKEIQDYLEDSILDGFDAVEMRKTANQLCEMCETALTQAESARNYWSDFLNGKRKELGSYLTRYGYAPDGSEPSLQMKWRSNPPEVYSAAEAQTAVIDALITQGGVPAWSGDGVGCVEQMLGKLHSLWRASEMEKASAQQALKDATEPRPIETAPRDGTNIIVFGTRTNGSPYTDTCSFFGGRWTIEWMDGYGSPTHWLPLPKLAVES